MPIITREFYNRPAIAVARDLLGCHLVRSLDGVRMVGMICETEAYQGEEDQGCHARVGRTTRTTVMYGDPGHAYIYFTYGMHWLLNAVTGPVGMPAAVLIRAINALEGVEMMTVKRPHLAQKRGWLNGPAKLTQALGLNGQLNGHDRCEPGSELTIESGIIIPDEAVSTSARVGLNTVPEPWKSVPWRFLADLEKMGA